MTQLFMISFESISKLYPNHIVFDQCSLQIMGGEFITITGHSGCGKTTLIKLLLGEEKPTNGRILVDNVNIADMSDRVLQFYRRRVGVVFQDYKLLLKKTVYENVSFAMEVCGEEDHVIHKRVPEVLDLVGVLSKQMNFPLELSGGEQQRVAIARALVHNPRLLIADEPTGNLDIENSYGIMNLLKKISEMGTTVILTTHAPEMVRFSGKRVVSIEKGKILYDGPTSGYLEQKNKVA